MGFLSQFWKSMFSWQNAGSCYRLCAHFVIPAQEERTLHHSRLPVGCAHLGCYSFSVVAKDMANSSSPWRVKIVGFITNITKYHEVSEHRVSLFWALQSSARSFHLPQELPGWKDKAKSWQCSHTGTGGKQHNLGVFRFITDMLNANIRAIAN